MQPASQESVDSRGHFLKMNGREIFKSAVRVMERAAIELLEKHGFDKNEVDHVIPHQANARIVESLSQRLEIPLDRFYCNLHKFGNTSAASIPLALDEAYKSETFKKGDLGLLVAFGAGLTWSATLVRF
jgi:3-oxoacyl-[acyl-carrier-protein] synthase-3